MSDSRPAPIHAAAGKIPELTDMQGKLASSLLSLCRDLGLPVCLKDCIQTPTLTFQLQCGDEAAALVRALLAQGMRMEAIEPKQTITPAMLAKGVSAVPLDLVIFEPLYMSGRMIHGASSGILLSLVQDLPKATQLAFPSPQFEPLTINSSLQGQDVLVCDALLHELRSSKIPKQLDIVYTWVDDADPVWAAKRRAYRPDAPSADAEHKARFLSHNELLYSLRSLFRYFNGFGNVYLVTDGQVPDFLGEFEGRVTVIDHADIMGDDVARPTFNSHVIESCLHHIEGLSDQYLYLNDDFLFAKPTCPADFFDHLGHSKVFYSNKAFIPKGKITARTVAVDVAAINLRTLLAERFDHHIVNKFQHTPVAVHRDIMFKLERDFPEQFAALRQNRFRSRNDLSPIGSFYLHYAVMIGRAIPDRIRYRYYETAAPTLVLKLMKLSYESATQRPKVHCINSTGDKEMGRLKSYGMQSQLRALYPPANSPLARNTALDRLRFSIAQIALKTRKRYRRVLRRLREGGAQGQSL